MAHERERGCAGFAGFEIEEGLDLGGNFLEEKRKVGTRRSCA